MSRDDVAEYRRYYLQRTAAQPWGEAAAVAVLLGFGPIADDNRFAAHVDREGVDWDAVLADKSWTASEHFLIATAASAWHGRRTLIDISRVAWLDDDFLQAWLAIVHARIDGYVRQGDPDRGGQHDG